MCVCICNIYKHPRITSAAYIYIHICILCIYIYIYMCIYVTYDERLVQELRGNTSEITRNIKPHKHT